MEDRSDYFKYKKGDVAYEDSLCAFCKYFNQENPEICVKYPEGKPEEIITSDKKCEFIDLKEV